MNFIWGLITRRNLIIALVVIAVLAVSSLYYAYSKEKQETIELNNTVVNLTKELRSKDDLIISLNEEAEKLVKANEELDSKLSAAMADIETIRLEEIKIKNSLDVSLQSITDNPDNYEFKFNKESNKEEKVIKKTARDNISALEIKAMWDSYCVSNRCK